MFLSVPLSVSLSSINYYQIGHSATLEEGGQDRGVPPEFLDVLDHLHQADANDGGLKKTKLIVERGLDSGKLKN